MSKARYAWAKGPEISAAERRAYGFLVVDPDSTCRAAIRGILLSEGYKQITEAPDHAAGLEKIRQRHVTHVIFDARATNITPHDFLASAFEWDDRLVALPSSAEPTVDDVFGLLTLGARGYLAKPFTPDTLESALLVATKGEPLSASILFAKNRNEALVSFAMTALDRLGQVTVDARSRETARAELLLAEASLRRAVEVARAFSNGGDKALTDAMIEFLVERASGPATRLGRLRKRLGQRKDAVRREIAPT